MEVHPEFWQSSYHHLGATYVEIPNERFQKNKIHQMFLVKGCNNLFFWDLFEQQETLMVNSFWYFLKQKDTWKWFPDHC